MLHGKLEAPLLRETNVKRVELRLPREGGSGNTNQERVTPTWSQSEVLDLLDLLLIGAQVVSS